MIGLVGRLGLVIGGGDSAGAGSSGGLLRRERARGPSSTYDALDAWRWLDESPARGKQSAMYVDGGAGAFQPILQTHSPAGSIASKSVTETPGLGLQRWP